MRSCRRSSLTRVFIAATVAFLVAACRLPAQTAAPSCASHPAFARLDFWLGDWTVWVGTQQVGSNRITKVEGGCAITEEWLPAGGGSGRSLFFVNPADRTWRQVWVTAGALAPGGVKEKREVAAERPAVRFQGTVSDTLGRTWLDRTTLTPVPDGSVRQHIEISTDGGATWRTTFDAIYRRK